MLGPPFSNACNCSKVFAGLPMRNTDGVWAPGRGGGKGLDLAAIGFSLVGQLSNVEVYVYGKVHTCARTDTDTGIHTHTQISPKTLIRAPPPHPLQTPPRTASPEMINTSSPLSLSQRQAASNRQARNPSNKSPRRNTCLQQHQSDPVLRGGEPRIRL